ncbi:MAG: penicillin acylase family protein [Acidobacteria bacterium]|nr:MAG: penicillin acylase family protein [Acidobacteriota bacterium]REK01348.1 MAG: penicillin acylase family protein [Acidobacteriota bacterium]REK14304.1 MAG: penicillin acylase family protein [Acidobacteriota bacterium]REK45019.1 MAG: penicillin acylase family protein [Acidobacteriota bacterium]
MFLQRNMRQHSISDLAILSILYILFTLFFFVSSESRTKIMNKLIVFSLINLIALSGLSCSLEYTKAESRDKGLVVEGLKEEVIVRRDSRSVPYIEAQNDSDLYFAQGYETARDRLWQMDLLRRVASGRLSELFGRAVLSQDERWRRYGFKQTAEDSLDKMGPGLRNALNDYARGVNAYIKTAVEDDLLPIEFKVLQYRPGEWKPSDTMIIGKILAESLSTTWRHDIEALKAQSLPEEKREELLNVVNPRDVVLFGKDGGEQGESKKAKVKKAASALNISGDEIETLEDLAEADSQVRKDSLEFVGLYAEELAASNNWVISGKRTLDGKPILANDPHLRPGAPGIWYLTNLSAPGVKVSGVTFPGVPGVVLGHNENFAWGATNVGPDVQDLVFEEFNDKGEYRTETGWSKPKLRKEAINVRKGIGPETEPLEIEVVETRNGPIVGDHENRKYALKWTARDPSNQEFEAFFLLNRAKDWNGFKQALSTYGGPMQNFIYADTDGNIGWYAAGKVPLRKAGDGSVPYDGKTGDGEWTGYIPFEELPNLFNPPSGFIVTANQRIVGTDYKYQELTRQFAAPWRARRIYDLLNANTKITMNDVSDIQHDVFDIPLSEFAREVVRRGRLKKDTADLLKGWDGRITYDSKAAEVADSIHQCVIGAMARANPDASIFWLRDRVFQNALASNDKKWLPEGTAGYDDLISKCDSGVANAKTWGESNPAVFSHPLTAAPLIGGQFKVSYTTVDGSRFTPNVGAAVSMRHISKPGAWDETRFVLPLGQSGIPGSPHWTDQFEHWRTGKPAILLFSKDAIVKAAETTLNMKPAA